jgi:hypothetical protein
MIGQRPRHDLLRRLFLPALLAVAVAACTAIVPPEPDDPDYGNPQDPQGSAFEAPETTITGGPEEGSTISSNEVTITWTGNQPGMLFQTTTKNWITASPWSGATSVTLSDLAEWSHTFEVRSGYATGTTADPTMIDETPATITFTVDAVTGPALLFSPSVRTVEVGAQFTLPLWAEEVDDLMLVATRLFFDTDHLQVLALNDGNFLTSTGGSLATYNSFDNTAGTIDINLATATGSPPGVSGSGIVLFITFRVESARESSVTFASGATYLRDSLNRAIPVNELIPALVKTP